MILLIILSLLTVGSVAMAIHGALGYCDGDLGLGIALTTIFGILTYLAI